MSRRIRPCRSTPSARPARVSGSGSRCTTCARAASRAFNWFAPNGAESIVSTFTHSQFYSISWWWFWLSIPERLQQPGTWKVRYHNDLDLLAERSFVLRAGTAVASGAPRSAQAVTAGCGGGGLTAVHR